VSLTINQQHVTPLAEEVFRVAESQQKVATNMLVDTIAEQELLEAMLEGAKPNIPKGCEKFDYLIYTPFRYPPLKHGSRFGKQTHPSIFYGSNKINTAFAELAYYRFVYYDGMATRPEKNLKVTQHASFSVELKTERGLLLDQAPYKSSANKISDPVSYVVSQGMGEVMREMGVEAFSYYSARAKGEINYGIFNCGAICSTAPNALQHWSCITRNTTVTIRSLNNVWDNISFEIDQFLVEGRLPSPAI